MRRFSSRSTRTTFSRCRLHVLPTSVQTGANESASRRSASSSSAATSRRRVMPNAAISAVRNVSRASSSNSSASFGFEAGKPASTNADAELVEHVRDAQLLLRRERHALPLHAVAQGAVVDRDPAHVAGAGAATTSSHSA